MKPTFRTLSRVMLATTLPALAVVPFGSLSAQVKKAARPAVTKPAAANNSIIPLPLTPIVPAAQRLCAARTPSGLGYTVLRSATGPKPPADATVLVNYIGYLNATGAVFDQGMQKVMPVAGVIPGFSEGLQMAGKGGVIRLCIPAALGYGAEASGPIPANSDLVFQVEVEDFKTVAEMRAMIGSTASEPAAPPPPQP